MNSPRFQDFANLALGCIYGLLVVAAAAFILFFVVAQ